MACRENINGTILVCLGLFVFAASLCHCTSMTRLNVPDKPRDSLRLGQSQAKGSHHRHGRLLIGQYALPNVQLNGTKATKNILHVDTDYQADMGWIETKQPSGQGAMSKPNNAAVERLLKMEPNIECTGDSMNLQVEDAASTPGSLLFVDRGSRLSPIPLSKLPSSCGYSIRSTRKDLVLVAPYDGCFVSLEEDCYVLPLRWCGIPVRMSCPLKGQSSPNPPMVTCHAEGMVVKIESTISASNIKVNLNGNWEPLMKASHRCGFTIIEQSESVVISVGYGPCLEEKDGLYTFELAGDGETKISCPSLQPVHPEFIQNPSNVGQGENGVPKPGATWGQVYQPFHPDHFYRQPKPEIPRATKPTSAPRSPQPEVLQGQVDQPFYSYPFYRQPTPEIPTATHFTADPRPQKPGAPWGQVQQPFYPFYTQPNPEIPQVTKPTVASQPLKPGLPYPFYPQPQPEVPSGTKPIAIPQPQKPEVHQGQVQQPFYPHSFYLQPQPEVLPATKPTSTPQLPESDMPQGHLQQPFCFYPYYPQQQPEIPPTTKPIATPQPQNLGDPQGQVQQLFCIYPSYPQPKPDTKPTAAPWLPQPEVLQGQVDQPFYSYPFHRQPTPEIPTATHFAADPQPQKPGAPWGQVQQPFYPFYTQPNPEIPQVTKPTVASQPLKPGLPYPFYPQPQPEVPSGTKPIAIPQPQKPEVHQGQVQEPFYHHSFYLQPQPEVLPATKPTSTPQLPESDMPQGHLQQPFCFYPYYPQQQPEIPPTTKPIATPQPQNLEDPQGQVQQPFCIYPSYPQPKPDTKPTAAPWLPQPEVLQGQVDQPFYSYPFHRQPTPEIPTATHFAADPRPQKPGAPWGQVQQPFYPFYTQPNPEIPQVTKPTVASQPLKPGLPYPFYPQPQPEVPSGTKPIAIPQPQKPEVHQGQVQEPFYPHSFYLQPQPEVLPATKPTSTPQLPESDMPQGHLQQPFCFYPYYPQQQPEIPPTTKPIATPQPQNLGDPQGQVQQPFCIYPSYPQPKPDTKPTAAPWLPQPEVLQGQVDQPFYSYPFHRQPTPEIPTATHFAADPRPQKPGVPQGQEQQPSYPYNLHPQPQPEIPPATKPSAAHQPLKPEVPQGHIQPPFNPYPFYPRPKPVLPQGQVQPFYHQPTAKPTAAPLPPIPPVPEAPHGQVHQLFYPSKIPGAETTEDDSPMDKPPTIKPPQSEIHHPFHQPLNQFYFPQQPQQHVPSMYCPQVCPSGFSNCCIQMAFHQHVHHIIPFGSKDAHQFYPGLPFSQPPDGNLAALPGSNPSETAHPQPPVYHFPYYSHWPYPPQNKENVLQSHSPVLNNRPPGPPAPGYEPMSRETHYELYNLHSTTQGNDWQSAGNMNEQNVPDILSSESISDFLVPYSMLHDAPVPTDNYSEPQPFVSGSKNSQHEKTLNSHSEPTGYVLLHHGPPGREPNTVGDSQMSFGDLAHNSKSVAQNPARLHSNKSQNRVKLLQEKSQSSELKSHNLPGHVDDIQRLDVESDVPWLSPALHGPHSESHESFSAAHLKPKFPESFKDLWKSLKPLGYSQRHQPPVPGKVFQRVSSASDHQANGSKQPPQIEPGPRN